MCELGSAVIYFLSASQLGYSDMAPGPFSTQRGFSRGCDSGSVASAQRLRWVALPRSRVIERRIRAASFVRCAVTGTWGPPRAAPRVELSVTALPKAHPLFRVPVSIAVVLHVRTRSCFVFLCPLMSREFQ